MSWVALDDQIFMNKKVARCDPNTKLLYIVGLVYCGNQLTDGYIEQDTLPLLAGMAGIDLANAKQNASKLVSIGLWDVTADQTRSFVTLFKYMKRFSINHTKPQYKATECVALMWLISEKWKHIEFLDLGPNWNILEIDCLNSILHHCTKLRKIRFSLPSCFEKNKDFVAYFRTLQERFPNVDFARWVNRL